MAKSGNRIHGTLHDRVRSPFGRKAWLVELVQDEGWSLERSDVIDAGEWNERRNWSAVKGDQRIDLGSSCGGMSWEDATFFFMQKALGMKMSEIENIRQNT